MPVPAPAAMEASLRRAGFRGTLRQREPLADYTTWRIGGPADLLAVPADREDLVLAVAWAADGPIPWRVLGNGSNLLVRDSGVSGLVLRVRKVLDDVAVDRTRIAAGAGASLPALANLAASKGLAGLEFAAGIPGTVGGALVMNAGWHEHDLAGLVDFVEFLRADGRTDQVAAPDCGFGYRRSIFRDRPGVVLRCELEMNRDDPVAVQARQESFASSRRRNQPTELPSCGSVFLKPEGDYAGRLIEAAGLKGVRIGDVQISEKHANFFVNLGRATSAQVLDLVELAEREVEARFGVRLEREFEVW